MRKNNIVLFVIRCLIGVTRRMPPNENRVSLTESKPLILPSINHNITYTGDIICPSLLYSTTLSHPSNQNSSQINSIDNTIITKDDFV
ncbi:unnamed protein product, partial [Rotaria magnacalcarata]